MAFVVQSVSAIAWTADEAITSKFFQNVEIVGTATGADVALDIGNPTGTFWTSVNNVAMLNCFKDCLNRAASTISMLCPQIEDAKAKVGSGATLATGQYKQVTVPGSTLGYTLFAAEGVSTFRISIVFNGKPDMLPVQSIVTA